MKDVCGCLKLPHTLFFQGKVKSNAGLTPAKG